MWMIKIYDPFKETTDEMDPRVSRWSVWDYLASRGYNPQKYGLRCGCIHLRNNVLISHYVDVNLTIYELNLTNG